MHIYINNQPPQASWLHRAVNMLSWIFISYLLRIPFLVSSQGSCECLVRNDYRLHHEGKVMIAGFFPAYAIYPLNKTADWSMQKFVRDFMVQ